LLFTHHVYQLDTCQQSLRSPKLTESQHRPCLAFNTPMVLLHQVVQILAMPASMVSSSGLSALSMTRAAVLTPLLPIVTSPGRCDDE
jgi:hypothetical protein